VFRGRRRIAGKTEAEVFAAVKLPYIEPELRENRGEIEAAREGRLPALISLQDIKGDLHVHSEHSDGTAPIRQMALAARERGLAYIAITDHSPRVAITRGLNAARLRREGTEIDRINVEDLGVQIFKGIEVDILLDGTLDLPDSILANLDMVVAAVHGNFHLSRDEQTARIEKALSNPLVTILAHPTGRMFGTREGYDVDMERIIRAATRSQVTLEINAQPDRLDLSDIYCRMAKELGARLAISSDGHAEQDYDNLVYGVAQARRGWLERKHVINTLSLVEMRAFLARRKAALRARAAA
jgi:DNA polymerase (family 10)